MTKIRRVNELKILRYLLEKNAVVHTTNIKDAELGRAFIPLFINLRDITISGIARGAGVSNITVRRFVDKYRKRLLIRKAVLGRSAHKILVFIEDVSWARKRVRWLEKSLGIVESKKERRPTDVKVYDYLDGFFRFIKIISRKPELMREYQNTVFPLVRLITSTSGGTLRDIAKEEKTIRGRLNLFKLALLQESLGIPEENVYIGRKEKKLCKERAREMFSDEACLSFINSLLAKVGVGIRLVDKGVIFHEYLSREDIKLLEEIRKEKKAILANKEENGFFNTYHYQEEL